MNFLYCRKTTKHNPDVEIAQSSSCPGTTAPTPHSKWLKEWREETKTQSIKNYIIEGFHLYSIVMIEWFSWHKCEYVEVVCGILK